MEEAGRLLSVGSKRVWQGWATNNYKTSTIFLVLLTAHSLSCPALLTQAVSRPNSRWLYLITGEGNGTPLQYSRLENPMDGGAWWAAVHGVAKGRTRLSDFTFTFHFHALEKKMATHSNVLAWRIPGMGEPGELSSMGLHRVGHDWSDLAAAAYLITSLHGPRAIRGAAISSSAP